MVITRFGISDEFSYPVHEFMLKNDALENGTSHIGLYGSAPGKTYEYLLNQVSIEGLLRGNKVRLNIFRGRKFRQQRAKYVNGNPA